MASPEKKPQSTDLPPHLALFQMVTGHYLSRAIYVAAKLGIADLLNNGPQSSEDLAKATATHAPSLNRLMRMLSSAGIFAEEENGSFSLTPIGAWLRSGITGSRRSVALLFAGNMMHNSWTELLYSVQTGKVAFDQAAGMDPFQYMKEHPEEAAIFNEAMTASSTQAAAAVVAAYDFSSFAKLADLGGGHGMLLATILKAHPKLRGVLFELPHVAEGAKKKIAEAGLSDRCEIVGGDFFENVPAGADAYMMKSVIHDWDDARSVAILKNCLRVIPPHGKLLLVEGVLPARVNQSPMTQILAGSDINMMLNVGGRERTDAEFRALLDAAGFQLTRIVATEALPSVIEGVPA